MGATRYRRAEARVSARVARGVALSMAAALALGAGAAHARPRLNEPVIWHEDDRRDIPQPKERDPNLLWDGVTETFLRPVSRVTNPGRLLRQASVPFGGNPVAPAANVNTLDEVPNSSWFTNRIGLFPLTPEAAAQGPTRDGGPDRSEKLTISAAKTQGVSPGFRLKDRRGHEYFIRFDPKGYLGMSSAADVITTKILHDAGYWVPDDVAISFRRDDLVIGEGVTVKDARGQKRLMTEADVDTILAKADRAPDGTWRGLASLKLEGHPIGPFDWQGRRKDDPNDAVRHEDRRELRAFRIFAAWLGHYDTKQGNTLDSWVEEDGRHYVRHYVRDFGSTLGASAYGAYPRYNYEYSFDLPAIVGRAAALGLHEDAWRRVRRPAGLPEIGYFDNRGFDPEEFKPLVPNTAFANLTRRDGYWAAKIISAFTDEHLKAIVATAAYRDPAAAEYMVKTLAERRDLIARHWFSKVVPLDFFSCDGTTIRFHDLGAERGVFPGATARYRARLFFANADHQADRGGEWTEMATTELPLPAPQTSGSRQEGMQIVVPLVPLSGDFQWLACACQVNRGDGWSDSVIAYFSGADHHVVALDR